jgi:para-nitrobenzyl esterase
MQRPLGKASPTAVTRSGSVRGSYESKRTIAHYAGIPYAAPPVGPLRWRGPQPVASWSGMRQCTKPGAMAFQRAQNMDKFLAAIAKGIGLSRIKQQALLAAVKLPRKQREDCLTLNVRTPVEAKGLPVMVWIHGGDHTDGSGSDAFYSSNVLPSRGCVLVTMNYRLGLFGFLAHPELSAESDAGVSGNYGLLDQICALEWVRDNIANFGGNPNCITIFGESAGGQAVLNLMTAPKAQGLFHRAIAQSPSDSGRWLHLRQAMLDFMPAENVGADFASSVVGEGAGQIERLRAKAPEELSEMYRSRPEFGRYFYPCVDGSVLPVAPMTAFSKQLQAPVPLMIGYNADEGSLLAPFMHPVGGEFLTPDDGPTSISPTEIRSTFIRSYGSEEAVDQLMATYKGLASGEMSALIRHSGDHMFGVHVDHASRQHAAAGHPTYRYYFQAIPASPRQTIGAFHAAEVFYLFDTSFPLVGKAPDGHLLAREMGDRWFAFAVNADPSFPGRAMWPQYDPANPVHMVFDRPSSQAVPCFGQAGLDLMRQRIRRLDAFAEQ